MAMGGYGLIPNEDDINYVWQVKWTTNIVRQLVSFTNPGSTITNSDLELAALVLHEAAFSSISASLA